MRHGDLPIQRVVSAFALAAPAGCAPTVDVLGVFFPGWLVSTAIGVVASYAIVAWLGRHAGTQALADSGLFFVSLLVGIALAAWWVLFSAF
jgi:hypothetical protein